MFKNILKFFALFTVYNVVADAKVSLDYTNDGVLRKDGECNINFINFGINNDIIDLKIKKENNSNGTFNLLISDLKNANAYLNNKSTGYTFNDNEIKNYVKVSQNGNAIKDIEATAAPHGRFSLLIKNLKSCEGLSIKETFKTDVLINSYLYYSNVKPNGINHAYDIVEFGPSSNNVPYDTLKWNMNTGLDSAREKCGIYIDYHEFDYTGGAHWKWYLSTDNINNKKCDNPAFYAAVKDSYANYEVMEELFGDHYNGYVIKREGSGIGHMDGILVDQKYLIEIYQNGCDEQNKDQVICTISSNKKLTYKEFTQEFVKNCPSIIEDPKEEVKWSVDENGITAKYDSYSFNITNYNRGALPKNENESVSYKEFKAANSSGIARFNVCTKCGDGTYIGEKCKYVSCPENCTKCLDGKTCTECATGSELIDGACKKIITTTTTTTTTTITTTITKVPTTTIVEETETVDNVTEKEEPTESEIVDDEEETSDANDSDIEEEEVTDEPTEVKEDDDEDDVIEEATETENKPKPITKVVVVKRPKTIKKCLIKKN
ncbi:hypothetical protein H8356DRAFT_508467 [Neocallimastix lanati (nom. inval.)]|nr:hypothetical protein H8356DRAFT_508467 [Neocallimastix sp. JGI-2020a]